MTVAAAGNGVPVRDVVDRRLVIAIAVVSVIGIAVASAPPRPG